jgi:hypothetical protein
MTIVFSVIFPGNLPYFYDFLRSLECQSCNNFKLILINDGVINLDDYFLNINLDYKIYAVNDFTPFEIRIFGLKLVSDLNPEFIIFADSDDTFSPNRVETLVHNLKKYTFVCNDLDLIDQNGILIENAFWRDRIGDNFEFDIKFFENKNILGLGNSGMQFWPLKKMLSRIENFDEGNDWLFFSSAENDLRGLFVSNCRTNYRQHANNLIGRKSLKLDSLINLIDCKINHYSKLKSIGFKAFDIDKQLNKLHNINRIALNNSIYIENQLLHINSIKTNFFWWEETNYIK